jgi:hypothetical protein
MKAPENFGNPLNPFNVPVRPEEFQIVTDPLLHVAYYQINYMRDFAADVKIEPLDQDSRVRTIQLDCRAPYIPDAGLYMIFSAAPGTLPDHITDGAKLILGDLVTGDDDIKRRWIKLSRPDDEPFGVYGVSRPQADGYEKWRSLTYVTRKVAGQPTFDILAEALDDPRHFDKLPDDDTREFGHYQEAMWRAISRHAKKLKKERSS